MHKVRGHKANKFSVFALGLLFIFCLSSPFGQLAKFSANSLASRSQVFTLPQKVNEKVLIRSASSAGIICPQGMARI